MRFRRVKSAPQRTRGRPANKRDVAAITHIKKSKRSLQIVHFKHAERKRQKRTFAKRKQKPDDNASRIIPGVNLPSTRKN